MISIDRMTQDRGMDWYEEEQQPSPLCQLVIVTFGRCLYWIGGKKFIAEKGDFLFIPAGASYYGKSVPTVFHEKLVFSFHASDELRHQLPMLAADHPVKSKAGVYELCVERIRMIWKEWQEQVAYSRERMAAALLDLLALWSRELDRGVETAVALRHADKMKAYIADHYREKVTKEQLGDCIGRSPNHAASLFRRISGQTISEYVHAVRMRTAVYQLTESLLSVTEISDYLGYADVTYFQKIFKRTYGQPPSHYLKLRPLHV